MELNNKEALPSINKLSAKQFKKEIEEELIKYINDPEKLNQIGSFIFTKKAISRLQKIDSNIKNGNYLLLEGPTGSSKTKSIQIYCKLKGLELIQFNMSGEITEEDLKGRILSDSNSFSGFKFKRGYFSEAFINGKILLLDEINLANHAVLNYIANALDSKIIVLEQEENENGSHIFEMNKNFRLIATQNPNKDSFIGKREELPEKLLQEFNIINFPSLSKKELEEISIKIAEKNGYNDYEIIRDISDIHFNWVHSNEAKASPQLFTIRDINSVINAISKKENPEYPYDALICFYGMRYPPEERDSFKKLINEKKYISNRKKNYEFPRNQFKYCYPTKSFKEVDKYSQIAISNGRHILFTGKSGVGITSIAKWISSKYSKNPEKDFTFIFTPETTIGDLIGRFSPSCSDNFKNNIIEWTDGPLTDAIKNGYSGLFINIDSTDSKILERINCLLDIKEKESDYFFKIPENPEIECIKIDPNFRFYCTCPIDKLNTLSDAFLNRLTVIFIEDQLKDMDNNAIKDLIRNLMDQEELIFDYPRNLINALIEEHRLYKFSMSELSKLTKCCLKLHIKFPDISPEINIRYIRQLLGKDNKFDIPESLQKIVYSKLEKYEKDRNPETEQFYFESSSIKDLIVNIYSCMICNIHVCIIGKTGIGKTSFARTFSRIFRKKNDFSLYDILFSFNSESTIENLYGTFAFEEGKSIIVEGPLYKAIKQGLIFIADEFNLAEESIMQSFMNIFEIGGCASNLLIPGINKSIRYNKDFFIIICQNDSNVRGRRILPDSIKKKIREFEYPEPGLEDIYRFSNNIIVKELLQNNSKENQTLAHNLSNLMNLLNMIEIPEIGRWSMRDIRKIFRRINKQRESSLDEYQNIKDIHQILIYILSGVPKEQVINVFNNIIKDLKRIFILDENTINDLNLMVKSQAKIEIIQNKGTYIMKGNSGKRFTNEVNEFINKELHSLLDSMFYANFADIKEPLLICGPTGYKTFLAKIISHQQKIINLYQETSLSQLLGSTRIRDNINAKKYYLKEILSICKCKQKYKQLEKTLEQYFKEEIEMEKNKKAKGSITLRNNSIKSSRNNFSQNIEEIIKNIKEEGIIKQILLNLKDNLLSENENNRKNLFYNFTSYFQAGILIQNIFEQNYITLKGVDVLSPNVLERFNDLLNYYPKITLNEDLYNTFTGENKEIQNFSKRFRIIGISSIDNIINFSEASKSRFTLISTSDYESIEKKILIQEICPKCPHNFYSFINKFEEKFGEKSKIDEKYEISFKMINKILNLFKKLNEKENKEERNLILAIFYSFEPFMNDNEIDLLINILKEIFVNLNDKIIEKDNRFSHFQFYVKEIERDSQTFLENNSNQSKALIIKENDSLISNRTGLKIKNEKITSFSCLNGETLDFNDSFERLLDIIHMSISIHFPLIIEGEAGSGKNKALNYISQILGYELIKYQINESTTIDDLFGKEIINPNDKRLFFLEKSKLFFAIIDSDDELEENHLEDYNESNSIILFENIEQASPALLEALIPFFDQSLDKILLPFGEEARKKEYNIIATYDPSKLGTSIQNYLSYPFLSNSLIFKLKNYSYSEFSSIIRAITNENENYSDKEIQRLINDFFYLKAYSQEIQSRELFTINDLKKFDLFRNQIQRDNDNDNLNSYDLISKILFTYRFSSKKEKEDLEKKLKFKNENLNLTIKFITDDNINYSSFSINIQSKEEENDTWPSFIYSSKLKKEDKDLLEEIFENLTDSQKIGILFLLFGVNSKIPCIIQGPSCSGKTFLIKEFCKICNKELEIFDLSNESGLSLLTGQITPLDKINRDKILELKEILKKGYHESPIIQKVIDKIKFNLDSPSEWKPNQFDEIIKDLELEVEKKDNKKSEIIYTILEEMKKERDLTNLLKNEDSSFIKAMKKGKWILLNNIELAQPELSQKLMDLCEIDNCSLNLYEKGKQYFYSNNPVDENLKISDDFRIFITYNQYSAESNKRLSPAFINKCLLYSLFPIDENLSDTTFILSRAFVKNPILKNYYKELAVKLSNIHFRCKQISEEGNAIIGKKKFCGRTICSLAKIINSSKDINKGIIQAINDCYCNAFVNRKNIKNELLNIYYEKVDEDLINFLSKKEKTFDKNILLYIIKFNH